MKRKNTILFHASALLLLILGICAIIIKSSGYEILIFSKPALRILENAFFIFAFLIEAAFIAVCGIKTKKHKYFLTYIVILPLVLLFVFSLSLSISERKEITVQKYNYEEFDQSIVIVNRSVLFTGFSAIYETKNGIIIHKVTELVGDDGLRPLEDDPKVKITVSKDGIDYFYDYGNGTRKHCFIKYENGSFDEIKK